MTQKKYDTTDLISTSKNPAAVRNISIIAHVDHGKTTLTDCFAACADLCAQKKAGDMRYTDTRKDEQERCITIKSTALSLIYNNQETYLDENEKVKTIDEDIVINLIDSPGHIDFTSEVTAALRATDGSVVVVDALKGVQAQTITVTKQAITEKIKFCLFINKIDTVINTQALSASDFKRNEDAYHSISKIIDDFNTILVRNFPNNQTCEGYTLDDCTVSMLANTVAFGSGKMGWGLTLSSAYDFLKRDTKPSHDAPEAEQVEYYKKKAKGIKILWGEHYVNTETKKVTSKLPKNEAEKSKYVRGFIYYVLQALLEVKDLCTKRDIAALEKLVTDKSILNVTDEKELIKEVLKNIFPVSQVLMSLVSSKLPSPSVAQKYRYSHLSTAEDNSSPTSIAIKECDPNGPLIAFCSKKTPKGELSKPIIITICRVFSGTLKSNDNVLCLSDKYAFGDPITSTMKGQVQNIQLMCGRRQETVNSIHCGNIVGLTGIDKSLPGPGTLVVLPTGEVQENIYHPLKMMSFTMFPVMGRSIVLKQAKDIDKLIKACKLMQKLDLTCVIKIEDTGATVKGVGALHVEILIQDLQEMMGNVPCLIRDPVVDCCEGISQAGLGGMTKSPNNHNRITGEGYPLTDDLTNFIDSKTNPDFTAAELRNKEDFELEYCLPGANLKFTSDTLSKCLHIGDGNILYNGTSGFSYMNDMKGYITDGLKKVMERGPLCGEPVRGVQFVISDIHCHADAIHRGSNQIVQPSKRLFEGIVMKNDPKLFEPIYKLTCSGPTENLKKMMNVVNSMGSNTGSTVEPDGLNAKVEFKLALFKALNISNIVMKETSGTYSTQLEFDSFGIVEGDREDQSSELFKRIVDKRRENMMSEEVLEANRFFDRL